MDALRKAFQRAVQVPLNNVEQIWQEYNAFENGLSKMTVRFDTLLLLQAISALTDRSLLRVHRPKNLSPNSRLRT